MHIVVVGAGVIGLAVGYQLVKAGAGVTLIDRDPEADSASVGNAGGIAVTEVMPASAVGVSWRVFGWMADPLGPLAIRPTYAPFLMPWLVRFVKASAPREVERISRALSALNSRVYDDLLPMLSDIGLKAELHSNGALSLYETADGYRRDAAEWACKHSRGVVFEELTSADARRMEPALGPKVHRAVFAPQWSHIDDPKNMMQGLRKWLLDRGAVIQSGEVRNVVSSSSSSLSLELGDGCPIAADGVVIAAGAWSGLLARRLGNRVLLESERGYNMTFRDPGIVIERQLIFAERKFVATPLSCGLRIGGAAEFGGLNASPNFKRSAALAELARRYLPELRIQGGTSWAGHRPTTPDSLPVISASTNLPNLFYAFGHGHLGLTQAATTGRLICDLIFRKPPSIDMKPYEIARFRALR